MALLDSIGDPALTVGFVVRRIRQLVQIPEISSEMLRWSQTAIDLADGDPVLGRRIRRRITAGVSPSRMPRHCAVMAWPGPGWRQDLGDAVEIVRDTVIRATIALVVGWTFAVEIALRSTSGR